MRTSVADYLADFQRLGDEPAYAERVGCRLVRSTYGNVAALSYRFARELTARGIHKDDRVVLWGPNSAAWLATFFGCANRGVIAVPMDDAASPDFVVRVFEQVQARILVCSRDHVQPGLPMLFFEDLQSILQSHSRDILAPEKINPEDPLQIVFTSGTTAEPKGVVISHGNVLANVAPLEAQIKPYLKYERFVHPLRFLNLLPLSHVFGQFLGMYLPPLLRGTVFFQKTLKPADIIHTIRRERISVLVAVPRMLQSLKEKIERDLGDSGELEKFREQYAAAAGKHFLRRWWIFRSIHRQFGWKFWAFISGGAALDRETEEFWARLGFAVIQGYGLTETTSVISVNHPFKVGRGSIGKVLEGREVKLAPDGEILVRGSGVASGYWNAGELRSVASGEGWYHTGDIGQLDSEGNLFFKGRKKDVIVTPAGMNVYPEDLENALKSQTEVKDSVVVPLALNGNAEPCAVLILKTVDANAAGIIDRANQSLAEYQRIHRWVLWPAEDFPRTSTQKPRRAEIAEAAQKMISGNGAGTPRNVPLSDLISQITKRSAESVGEDARLDSDLNLSSLDRVELLSALEDRYQIDLSETRFSAVNTVGDLQRMLKGETPARVVYHYPAWVQRWPVTWVRFMVHYLLLLPSVFVLGWPRIVGRENLRGVKGPVLVVCNHIGDVDVGFILAALPARLRHKLATAAGGEALEALRTPPATRNLFARIFDRIEWFLGVSLLNLFPLPREAGFRDSFAFAGESVDRGYSVLVFPEGHHTTDGKMRPFRSGVGLLVNDLNIPVVPMRIDGLFEIKQAGKRMARPFQIKVRIGAPIEFPRGADPQRIATELQSKVGQL
ncbi:MAG: AMP-dependent synthetase and ligase [Acidobacteriaceae bacterium]|nr:AMP-dependent synthetase and ligase [Acidobacteriaceae bacterium]